MTQQFDTVQKFGKESFDATANYAKKSFEQGAATFEKLVGVKSLDKAIEIQSAYVQDAYKDFVAQATKSRELYTKLAQDTFAPFGALRSTAESALTPAKATPRAK